MTSEGKEANYKMNIAQVFKTKLGVKYLDEQVLVSKF